MQAERIPAGNQPTRSPTSRTMKRKPLMNHQHSESNPIEAAAHAYADEGFRVIPVTRGKKGPTMPKWPQHATRDHDQIHEWFKTGRKSLAIATGVDSRLLVVDVDGPEGQAWFDSLGLPETRMQRTGRGKHYLFASDKPFKNRTKLFPEVDIRSDGGCIMAAPSPHPSGVCYEMDATPIAPLPEALEALLTAGEASSRTPQGRTPKGSSTGRLEPQDRVRVSTYDDSLGVLPAEVTRALSIGEDGHRHQALATVWRHAIHNDWDTDVVVSLILAHPLGSKAYRASRGNPQRWLEQDYKRYRERSETAHLAQHLQESSRAKLTNGERKVLDALQTRAFEHGGDCFLASYRDIHVESGMALGGVSRNVLSLVSQGWVQVVTPGTRVRATRWKLTLPAEVERSGTEHTTRTAPLSASTPHS